MALLSGHLLRRAGWNLADQALSALSNVALAVIVARSVDAPSFGAFAVALMVFGIAVALTQSVAGQPLQIRHSGARDAAFQVAAGRSLGSAFALSLLAALACVVSGLLVPGETGRALLVLALVMPGLLIQDTCRMAFFAIGQASRAALIDAVWAAGQFLFLALLLALGHTAVEVLILAWGVAASISAVLGLALHRVRPRLSHALLWLRDQYALIRYLVPEYVLGLGAFQVGILVVGVIASGTAVGALRAAQVLLGPLNVLGTATFQFAIPEVSGRKNMSARRRGLFGLGLSGVMGAAAAVYVVIVLLIPDSVGLQLFGDSWAGAAPVLLPLGVNALASALATGPAAVLIGMGRARATFRLNLLRAPLLISLLLIGTTQWGAVGAAWGLAATEIILMPLWFLAFRRAIVGS